MNVFKNPVTEAYDLTDATWEIIIILLIAFILGWLFNYFWSSVATKEAVARPAAPAGAFAVYTDDNLKIVEGIGPKIEELLKANSLTNWEALAKVDIATLKKILTTGGDRFQMHDPSSWADQAALAHEGKWGDLEEYQTLLVGGRSK